MKTNAYLLIAAMVSVAGMLGCAKTPLENESASFEKGSSSVQAANATGGTDYYVSKDGNNGYNGLSPTFTSGNNGPFRTVNFAASKTQPGDVVNITAGTYTWEDGNGDAVLNIKPVNSGTLGHPITYKGNPGTIIQTKITDNAGSSAGGINNAVDINADYITIQDIEFIGHRQAIKDEGIIGGPSGNLDGDTLARYNTNGIGIGGFTIFPTGTIITNCKVHDFPGNGIAAKSAGDLLIDGNTTYNNSNYSRNGTSGISIIYPKLVGSGGTSYGYFPGGTNTVNNIVRNNVSYNNQTLVRFAKQTKFTDGNGIIIDINYGNNINGDFTGLTLVENNICYTNGGAGINITSAQNVNVVNNTTCNNGQALRNGQASFTGTGTRYTEAQLSAPRNVFLTNNIFYSNTAGGTPTSGKAYNNFTGSTAGGQRTIFDYNIYPSNFPLAQGSINSYIYDESAFATTTNTHNLNPATPGFTGTVPTTLGGTAISPTNFKLANNSPALNSGLIGFTGFKGVSSASPKRPYYSYFSYDNVQRTSPVDRGAFEQ